MEEISSTGTCYSTWMYGGAGVNGRKQIKFKKEILSFSRKTAEFFLCRSQYDINVFRWEGVTLFPLLISLKSYGILRMNIFSNFQ